MKSAFIRLSKVCTEMDSRVLVFLFILVLASNHAFAAGGEVGAGMFDTAATDVGNYMPGVSKLMKAIAAVIAIVGAFNIYFKMQNGDQDVKKTIMLVVGGCIAFVVGAEALPKFFGY